MQKLGILIGRFQPLHAGHRELIKQAKAKCDTLLILVGSANASRSVKNPWTFQERKSELLKFLSHENINFTYIQPINDYAYSDSQWLTDIISVVSLGTQPKEVILFGFEKEGNNYLKWFPQFKFENITTPYDICSTDVRKEWFNKEPQRFDPRVVADWNYFHSEKKIFANYPFKETLNFNCGDAILECCGHVLLIQRGAAPGMGTWALPGGFKNADETFEDCAIRELIEETNVRIPEKVLRGSITHTRLFDNPSRGNGIPRNTLAVHIKVLANIDGTLPRANGMDDAVDSKWVLIADALNNMELFDDHAAIISTMCGVLPIPAHVNPRYFN